MPRHKRGCVWAPSGWSIYRQHLMKVYVDHMRHEIQCEGPSPNNLFLTKDGVALDARSLNRQRADLRVSATNIRKWIVTTCHKKKDNNIDELTLRLAMCCHSTWAAEHFYLRESVTHIGVVAAKIIESFTSLITESPSPAEKAHCSENEPDLAPSVQPTAAPAGEPTSEAVTSLHPIFQETLSAAEPPTCPSENEPVPEPFVQSTSAPAGEPSSEPGTSRLNLATNKLGYSFRHSSRILPDPWDDGMDGASSFGNRSTRVLSTFTFSVSSSVNSRLKVFAFIWFEPTLSAILSGMPSIFRRSCSSALESMMGLISCTVTFLCKCIRSYQHSDIALFSIPVNGLWFTGVETGGAMVLCFWKFLVRRLMCQQIYVNIPGNRRSDARVVGKWPITMCRKSYTIV